MSKVWVKPELEILDINMTEATTYDAPDEDEAYNGDNTARIPGTDKLVPHHES